MPAQNAQAKSDPLTADDQPIAFLTENGFLIVRRWEADHEPQPADGIFSFLVTNPNDQQTLVTVQVDNKCREALTLTARQLIPLSSAFWAICAERHLAEYLWEHNQLPQQDRLIMDCLDPEETVLAGSWALKQRRHA